MTEPNPRTDRHILVDQAYADDTDLNIRYQVHDLYSRPKVNFQQWVIERLDWTGDEQVLDVGTGPGSYIKPVLERIPEGTYTAGDLSFGMARQAQANIDDPRVRLITLDAQALPFADNSFDVVLANHMLYHVPDIDRALREIQRVLRPTGCLVAATNSKSTMPQFDTLTRRTCSMLGCPRPIFEQLHDTFSLENGILQLAQRFEAVARYDLPGAFHFPEAQPAIDYLNSMRAIREHQLPDSITWNQYLDAMQVQIERLIIHFGELQVSKLSGVLVATERGGFAADYLQRLHGA